VSRRSPRTRPCSNAQSSGSRTRTGGAAEGLRHAERGRCGLPEEIIAFCRERLAHYKCPDSIEYGPLPKTSTGKTQKFVLRQREWAGQDTQVGGV